MVSHLLLDRMSELFEWMKLGVIVVLILTLQRAYGRSIGERGREEDTEV